MPAFESLTEVPIKRSERTSQLYISSLRRH